MIPTLDKKELQDRMTQVEKNNPDVSFRKKKYNGVGSLELRLRNKIGRYMNGKIQPKDGLENKQC